MKPSVGAIFSLALPFVSFSSASPAPADAQITPPPNVGETCFTHTTILDQTICSDITCTVKPCISITSSTTPCPTLSCPETPTVTQFKPCPTTCRTGCATSTTFVRPDICPL